MRDARDQLLQEAGAIIFGLQAQNDLLWQHMAAMAECMDLLFVANGIVLPEELRDALAVMRRGQERETDT